MYDMNVSNEIEQPRNSLIDIDETVQYQKYLKKRKSKRIIIISVSIIILLILIIVIGIVASKNKRKYKKKEDIHPDDKEENKNLNVIIAKYFTDKDNQTITFINNRTSYKLDISLFINKKEKKFTNEYIFDEPNEYLVELKFPNELTNLTSLFMNINNLREVNLSGINSEKIKNMDNLFFKCSSLEKAHLNNLNTSNVE